MAKILLVDDEADVLQPLAELLTLKKHAVQAAETAERAFSLLKSESFDVVVTDIRLGDHDGVEVLRRAKQLNPHVAVIVMTGYADEESARRACEGGAYHYLGKPVHFDQLCVTIDRALAYETALRENTALRRELEKQARFENIIGTSPAMRAVFSLMQKVADSDATILILGESGTGKELVARALHFHSRRATAPFVTINCAALPENLLESELFGHKRGSFTGAVADKKGLFEEAHGGSIFLDEIALLPLPLQGKLLRVLQEREIRRVGDNVSRKVDVRVLAAAQHTLKEKVKSGAFREDLYYRLSVIPIEVPALRERRDDIPLLAQFFLKRRSESAKQPPVQISEEAMGVFLRYSWPGNVRELENVLERGATLCTGGVIRITDLPPALIAASAGATTAAVTPAAHATAPPTPPPQPVVATEAPVGSPEIEPLENFLAHQERAYIRQALARCGDDKKKAAQLLGISLATLYRKLGGEASSSA